MDEIDNECFSDPAIGIRLGILRTIKGETLRQLSKYIGISHSTLERYEKGELHVPIMTAHKIAFHYGLTPEQTAFIFFGDIPR